MRFILPLTLAFCAGTSQAQTTEITLTQDGLKARIEYLSIDPVAHEFEIGMLQTLHAVEKTLQARYEYGLGSRLTGLPVLRLSTGDLTNPSPKPSDPGTLSELMGDFVGDIATARIRLTNAETSGVVAFELTLNDIWFDINANGTREESESAVTTLGAVVLGRRAYREFTESDLATQPLTIRFDNADHAWLMAYTHMLSGFGDLFLAFDPEPVLRDLATKRKALANAPSIPNYYDPEVVKKEIAVFQAEASTFKQQLDEMRPLVNSLRDEISKLNTDARNTDDEGTKTDLNAQAKIKQDEMEILRDRQRALMQTQRFIRNELSAAENKLPGGHRQMFMTNEQEQTAIDLIYVIITALQQNPDPVRIQSAHTHLREMIAHNRIFWQRLAAETDNDREWIPNATQETALPLTFPPLLAESWQNILLDVEAVLDGKLLIPHPLLSQGYGISLPAYVADPSPLDIVNWLHGIGAYRYAAKGPRLTLQSWRAFQRLSLGNAGGFALMFN